LAEKIPSALSNPFEYPYILALANLVILIQEKLQCEVPLFIPTKVIPWGVDQTLFHPSVPKESKWRELFEIKETEKVIVYHGGLNGFTRPAMMDLCKAVELINLAGVPCKLIRTGVNPINFWDELNPGANKWIIEAGVVGKDELPSILSLADIYVQPGRINPFEDLRLPSKLPEFLAMGKPVILPNVNIAHLFQDGVNAVLLQTGEPQEIAEKCLLLFNDEKNCESLGLGARQFAQDHFEIGKQVMGLISAYKDAISFFNPEQTKNLWATLKTEGAMGAALKSAGYCLEGPAVDRTLVANQLLIWGHQNNNQLQLLNKRYFELQQLNTRLMDSASKMPSSHFWQKLRRFFKL
jgi:glycosyltransferase involved in cell wall biosynthesis